MTSATETRPWDALQAFISAGDAEGVAAHLASLPTAEAVRAMAHLPDDEQAEALRLLPPEEAAALLSDLPDVQEAALLERLPPAEAAALLHRLPSDERADLIGALPHDAAERVLSELDPDEAREARRLAAYPPDTAGALMATEFVKYPDNTTVRDIIDDFRANAERYAVYDVQYAYVTDVRGRLVGVLRLRDLLLAPSDQPVSRIMIPDPVSVSVHTPLRELVDLLERHRYLGVPVVDRRGRVRGVVHRAAVHDALEARAEADYRKTQGIVGGEELRSMPLLLRSRRRLSWLCVNIVLNIIAASVIAFFTDTLEAVIALAVFLPIISDMSGSSGNQAVGVSLRELTLGVISPAEMMRVWRKEMSVGVLNGVALGAIIGAVAMLYGLIGPSGQINPYLGLVAGAALALNTVIASSIGGLVPLVLRRLNLDPALASGLILTTVTDICGFLLVLGFATVMLSKLTG